MDGLEAAAKILEIDPAIPIVAMTANVMTNDRDIYESVGMVDCVGKPFTSKELWRCLIKYFKPLSWQNEDEDQRAQRDIKLRQRLINNFVKNNRLKYAEVSDAINAGDITLAHRLVHTLKSNAGQLNKTLLQHAADELERSLAKGINNATPQQMKAFETELKAAIAELEPMVYEPDTQAEAAEPLDNAAARELLEKVGLLLETSNAESLNYLDEIKMIPGCDELVHQIEELDFMLAAETLDKWLENKSG
jgi:CheY-like chemotaxis protein